MITTGMNNGQTPNAGLLQVVQKLKLFHSDPSLPKYIKSELGSRSSASNIFYIKSEIKRLSRPCARLIDLRNLSNDIEFSPFEWDGLTHVLDKESAKLFLRLIKAYDGKYTFGVYEEVIRAFKQNKSIIKDKQFASDIEIEAISLTEIHGRNEERMNLCVKIDVHKLPEAMDNVVSSELSHRLERVLLSSPDRTSVDGSTVDISQNGIQAKLSNELDSGQIVMIRFKGLEDDYVFDKKLIAYKVISSIAVDDGETFLVSFRQLDLPEHAEFQLFTKRLIYANKRRYKVNLDNTVKSVRSKLYEQFYLSRRRSLDLFSRNNSDIPFVLASEPCLEIVNWFTNRQRSYICDLMKKDGVVQAANAKGECYWVVLKKGSSGSNDGASFYSSILSTPLSYKFAFYALSSGLGRVFKVSSSKIDDVDPFITSSLPRSVHKQMGDSSIYRYEPKLKRVIADLSHMVTVKEVATEDMRLFDLKGFDISKDELKQCSRYFFNKIPQENFELVRLESNDFRKEDRFSIATAIEIRHNGRTYSGKSLDVSTCGMSIKITDRPEIKANSEVHLTLSDLIEGEDEFNLRNIPYKVISCNDGILRLEALTSKGFVGVKFWRKYISDNIDSLKIVGSQESFFGLRRALRNIVAQLYQSTPAFFKVKESKPCVTGIGLSKSHSVSPFWSSIYSSDSVDAQLRPFLYHKSVFRKLVSEIPEVNKTKPYKSHFVLLKYKQGVSGKIDVVNVNFLPTEGAVEAFSDHLKGYEYSYRVFNVSLTKKSRLFNRYFKDELQYLESYAAHKAKGLVYEIKTLTGVLDFDDVTQFFDSYARVRGSRGSNE